MKNSVRFSFVLPAWKGRYLQETIQSIVSQSYQNFELVVVDDCSPDAIKDIVGSFEDGRITYHRNKSNIGGQDLVAQWNRSLEFARGEYVILATDDDLYEPTFLSSSNALLEQNTDIDLMRARILQVNSEGSIIAIDDCYKGFLSKNEFVYHMLHGMKGGIPQYIFKRKTLVDKGGFVNFAKAWASDDATAIMMAEHGVLTSQQHLVRFRWSDINISSDPSLGYEKLTARLQYNKWLRSHLTPISRDNEWNSFLATQIDDYLAVYQKQTLISTIQAMGIRQKIGSINLIIQAQELNMMEKLSVLYHSLF